jgi:YbbR domain-containing protein
MQWWKGNTGLKIIAVALGTVTWLFVKGITSDTNVLEVPLEIKLRPGTVLLESSAQTVAVKLRGTREDLLKVQPSQITAIVDLRRDERVGQWQVRLGSKTIHHPSRVQIAQVNPPTVTVCVDEIAQRDLPVQSQIVGELSSGLAIERVVLTPSVVHVKGPKSSLERLSTINTLPIDVAGRRTSFRERVELAMNDPSITLNGQRWVEADVRIAEARSR